MARDRSNEPQDPDDWIELANRELSNLSGSYRGKLSNDTKIDHSLRAVEAVLKAIIWKKKRWNAWPAKGREYDYLYRHNIGKMLDAAGLRERLNADPEIRASWQVLENAATKQYRYHRDPPPDKEANAVAKSARYPDTGVVPWLMKIYREIK